MVIGYNVCDVNFMVITIFDEIIQSRFFYQYSFHVGVRPRITNLILNTILNIYPSINVMNKGMQSFKKCMCGATNHNPFGSVLTDVNEVLRFIVLIPDNIIFSLYKCS